MSFSEQDELERRKVPLKHYVAVFFRYRSLIAAVTLGGSGLGVILAVFFIRPLKVWDGQKIIRVRSPWAELETLTGDPSAIPRRQAFYIEAEIEQFYDQTLLGKVVDRCGLAQQQRELYGEFQKTLQGKLSGQLAHWLPFLFEKETPTGEEFREAAIRDLGKNLTVEPSGLSRRSTPVLNIQYANVDRSKVAQVIDALLEAYQERKRQDFAEGRAARKQRELFAMRFEKLKKQYEEKRDELKGEYEKLGLPFDCDPSLRVNLTHSELLQLEGRVEALQTEVHQVEAQRAQLQAQLASFGSSVPETAPPSEGLPEASLELNRLLDQFNRYNQRVTELEIQLQSPEVATSLRRHLKEQLASVRAKMQQVGEQIAALRARAGVRSAEEIRLKWELAFHEAGLRELKKQLVRLKEKVDRKRSELELLQANVSQLSLLRQEFHRVRTWYEQEVRRREEREIYDAARKEITYLEEVTTRVKLSEKPRHLQRPSRSLLMFLSFAGSFLLGCALAFFLGVLVDSSFHNSEEAEKALGVPVLAHVPEVRKGFWGS